MKRRRNRYYLFGMTARPETLRWIAEALEPRMLLSAVTWTGAAGDNQWTTPGNWSSTPLLPGPSDDVTIPTAAGTIHLGSGTQSINKLTAGEALSVDTGGTIAVATTSQLTASTTLSGGTVSGGIWTFTGAGNQFVATTSWGTLSDHVTVNGNIDLSQVSNANITVLGGLVLNGILMVGNASGTTYGGVSFGSASTPAGSLTTTGAGTVTFGGSLNNALLNASNLSGIAGSLTLAANVLIRGKNGLIGKQNSGSTNPSFVNQGTISADTSGGTITVNCGPLSNSKRLSASNGGTLSLLGNWTNAVGSTIMATSAALNLGDQSNNSTNTWSNLGTITVANSTVDFGGTFTQGALGSFSRSGGIVNLVGAVGGGLSLDSNTGSWNILGGIINGEAVNESGGSQLVATASGGTLANGVTLNGNLDVTEVQNATVTILGGLVLNGTIAVGNASGTTSGEVEFGGVDSPAGSLTTTVMGTVLFGGSRNNAVGDFSTLGGSAGTLTFGPNILAHGNNGIIFNYSYYTASFDNNGTIVADIPFGTIHVTPGPMTNNGMLEASNGGMLSAGGPPVINNGTFIATHGGKLSFSGGPLTNNGTLSATDGGTLTVSQVGTGWINTPSSAITATGGTLNLGAQGWFTGDVWSNSGIITVANSTVNLGGEFTQAGLGTFDRTGGDVNIRGTLRGGLTLDATTGSWNVNGAWIQGGTINESAGSRLVFTSGVFSNAVTVNGDLDLTQVANANLTAVSGGLVLNGTMMLGNASGTINGWVAFGTQHTPAGSLTSTTGGTVVFGGSGANTLYNVSSLSGDAGMLRIGDKISVHGKNGALSNYYATGSLLSQANITADASGGTITVSGGALTNSGSLSASNGGTLTLVGALTDNGTMTFVGGGRLSGTAALTINSVPVNFGSNTTPVVNTIGALTFNGTASLDLANNALQITYGTNPDPVATIRGYITSGYNNGAWNGPGIITSSADANHALGFADMADGPLPGVPANTVEVKWTRIGDVNLDGTVNFSDLLALAQHFGSGGSGTGWDQGDMNYDGTVNFSDLLALAQNFGSTALTTGGSTALSSSLSLTAEGTTGGGAASTAGSVDVSATARVLAAATTPVIQDHIFHRPLKRRLAR